MPYPKTRMETNDNLTRKKWARDLFKVLLPGIEYNYLIGTGADAAIQMRTELAKGEGDEITFGIRKTLKGAGIVGRKTQEGNEEEMLFRDFKFRIEELNHAVDTGGKMEEQRIPYNLMQEGKDGLQDWWSDKLSDYVINMLVGNSSYTVAGETFAQAFTEPDSDHFLKVNDIAEASITNADVLDLSFLDRMKQRAELPTNADGYKIRPFIINGKKYFKVILHNYVFDALRQNMNVGQWGDLLRAANKLQMPEVEIDYNGMLISKSERIPALYTNTYRCVLMGAQAGCFAWGGAGESKGSTMSFVPYDKDAKRYTMIRAGGIFAGKKTLFESQDYGCLTGVSWGEALT